MAFPATRLSVVERIRSADARMRQVALATIVEAYWKPTYKYLRLNWRLAPEEASDLTQEFFLSVLEKDLLARYDPQRSRFRTYLRLCVDGFVSNVKKAERRLKRGGGVAPISLDFAGAEGELARQQPAVAADVEELFYQEWVRALFQRAVEALREDAQSAGRAVMFEVFRRYDLAWDTEARPTYGAIARELGLTTTTVTNHLAAMRRQFRRVILDRLRELTASDDEFEAEARRLLGGSR